MFSLFITLRRYVGHPNSFWSIIASQTKTKSWPKWHGVTFYVSVSWGNEQILLLCRGPITMQESIIIHEKLYHFPINPNNKRPRPLGPLFVLICLAIFFPLGSGYLTVAMPIHTILTKWVNDGYACGTEDPYYYRTHSLTIMSWVRFLFGFGLFMACEFSQCNIDLVCFTWHLHPDIVLVTSLTNAIYCFKNIRSVL